MNLYLAEFETVCRAVECTKHLRDQPELFNSHAVCFKCQTPVHIILLLQSEVAVFSTRIVQEECIARVKWYAIVCQRL